MSEKPTDLRTSPAPEPEARDLTPPPRGQSQWALIWREFRRRYLAVASLALLIVIITTSVFAPFLANGRPIAYFGFNQSAYADALRTQQVLLRQAIAAAAPGAESVAAPSNQTKASGAAVAALQVDVAGIATQFRLMREQLPAKQAAALAELEQRVTAALAEQDPTLRRRTLMDLRRQLNTEFSLRTTKLASNWHFPVWKSLWASDVFFMTLGLLLLTMPIWRFGLRWLLPARRQNLIRSVQFGIVFLVPVLIGLVWWLTVPVVLDRTAYREGVLHGDSSAEQAPVVYRDVIWPLIPYDLDGNDLDAMYLPPAWWPVDENSEDDLASESVDGQQPGDAPVDAFEAAFKKRRAEAELAAGASEVKYHWQGVHVMGTDHLGRDLFCRMIWGGRVSLSVGIVAVSIYLTIGIIVGACAGYFRGWVDMIISRVIEVVICFPSFFLILTIVAFLGPSIFNIMLVIGLTGWTGVARLVRGEFLRLSNQEFVLAGRALGYSPLRLIFRHVLPNAMAPVLVAGTFGIAGAILTESALSFLNLGITIPKPSWGGILAAGRSHISHAPWIIYFPGFAIFLTITAYNLMGEALRDASDPRLRGQR